MLAYFLIGIIAALLIGGVLCVIFLKSGKDPKDGEPPEDRYPLW